MQDSISNDNEVIESVREAHIAAMNNRDADAWADVFTDDAIQMPPNFPMNIGNANIRSWSQGFLQMFQADFTLSVIDLHISGDYAYETGTYTISLTPDGSNQTMQDVGKYITIYQKLSTGDWAVTRDIWNSNQPPS